jgi:hypothetical protein
VTTGTVQYQIVDDNNGTAPPQTDKANLTFQLPQNPTATNDGASGPVQAQQAADFQFTAQDPANKPLTYVIDSVSFNDGNVQADATSLFHVTDQNGHFHFDGGPAGTYVVTFHVTDGSAQSNQATFTIQVV